MKDGEKVLAYNFDGKRYDIGNKFGLLKANIEFGVKNEETRKELLEYLKEYVFFNRKTYLFYVLKEDIQRIFIYYN